LALAESPRPRGEVSHANGDTGVDVHEHGRRALLDVGASSAVAETAHRDLPQVSHEDALRLAHRYAERESPSPKFEVVAMEWLRRYPGEVSPTFESFANVSVSLAQRRR